jgi:hypothetical protein
MHVYISEQTFWHPTFTDNVLVLHSWVIRDSCIDTCVFQESSHRYICHSRITHRHIPEVCLHAHLFTINIYKSCIFYLYRGLRHYLKYSWGSPACRYFPGLRHSFSRQLSHVYHHTSSRWAKSQLWCVYSCMYLWSYTYLNIYVYMFGLGEQNPLWFVYVYMYIYIYIYT